jgi:tetratricopeptide (TPR) repeat protein
VKAQNHPLTVEEAWKRAYLTWKFQGNEAAIPLFQEVLTQNSQHSLANFQLGQILLEKYDTGGISRLETAIELDPALVIPGCELLYDFYKQLGQLEEAEAYLQRVQQHSQAWKKAQQERSRVSDKERFEPHNLPEREVKQIAQQLSGFPEVGEAYLVRKVVKFFPEKPFYVLGISRRFVKGSGINYKLDWELIEQLEAELNFSGEVRTSVFNQSNLKLKNALHQVKGACIYCY